MHTRTILITGGHPTPALAVIDEAAKSHPSLRFVFAGRRHVNSRETGQSLEFQEIFDRKISFVEIHARRSWLGALTLPLEIVRAWTILNAVRPDAILSFGGYVGVPVCIAAYMRGIPIYLHEQTMRPGLANRRLALIARRVMVSFEDTMSYFSAQKVVCTGNPIRPSLLTHTKSKVFTDLTPPVILVVGGNLGSHSVNTHIFSILKELLKHCSVIHQVGNIEQYDDWGTAQSLHLSLPDDVRARYAPIQHLATSDIASVYRVADCIVSRSGASTVMELIALSKPAVLIPLPWSAYGEQSAQAELLAGASVAEIFRQDEQSTALLDRIKKVLENVQSYTRHYEALRTVFKPHAASHILDIVTDKA